MNKNIIIFSLIGHLLFCLFLIWLPVVNDSGLRVTPLGIPAYLDYQYYASFTHNFLEGLAQPFNLHNWEYWKSYPGPIFPALLRLSDYANEQAYLGFSYILIGLFLSISWATFLAKEQVPNFIIFFAACFPLLLYYTHIVSTDLPFAVAAFLFYRQYQKEQSYGFRGIGTLFALALLASLIRPNGVMFWPIVICAILLSSSSKKEKSVAIAIVILISVYLALFYLPYYLEHRVNSIATSYWNIFPEDYWSGNLLDSDSTLAKLFSVLILFLSKLLYSFGIRPSYAGVDSWLILARAIPGIPVLVGTVIWFCKSNIYDRCFLALFLIPVFAGASQERYTFSIVPFALLWFWRGLSRRK